MSPAGDLPPSQPVRSREMTAVSNSVDCEGGHRIDSGASGSYGEVVRWVPIRPPRLFRFMMPADASLPAW